MNRRILISATRATERPTVRAIRPAAVVVAAITALAWLAGCQTFQQIAALDKVDFSLQSVSDVEVAGVSLDGIRSYGDLGPTQVVRILAAVGQGQLPLTMSVNVEAENPPTNLVTANLVRMDWTLLLEGRETVAGSVAEAVALPPGEPQVVPIEVSLDLLGFFNESGPDLVELVLALAGQSGGESKEVAVRAQPTIDTAIGPITYPAPITILRREVGG